MDKQLRKFVFNKNYCNSTNVLGVVLSTKTSFQDDTKEPPLEQDAEILGPYFQENIEREIVKRIVIAKNALDEKRTEKAEKALENAIALGEKSNGLPLGLTCAYEMLATIACGKGDITKAENLVISALRKFKTVNYTCYDNVVISFSMKLARLYKEANKVDAAESIFRKCLDAQEKKYYKGHTDPETAQLWVNTLFWYGKLLNERNRYQEAVKCFETCYHLSCQVKSIQIPQVMVILHNLAESAYFMGDKDKALRYLKHAIMIGRLVNFPDLPVFYIRIGNIYAQKGEYQEAKIWCEGGRKLSKAIKNKNHETEADTALKEIDRRLETL